MSSNRPVQESKESEKINQLNEAARRWKSEGLSDGERIALSMRVWELAFELLDDKNKSTAFVEAFAEACERFDPAKTEFYNYLVFLRGKRRKDAYKAQKIHAPDENNSDSLDAPISEENELTLEDVVPDKKARDAGEFSHLNGKLAELTAMILNFAQRHTGKSANETRRRWYRMFYTEDVTWIVREECMGLQRERDVLTAMELDYLDYYMVKKCRCLEAIRIGEMKPYHEVVPTESSMECTSIPLPANVSLAYWERCLREKKSAAARSQQLGSYRKELESL